MTGFEGMDDLLDDLSAFQRKVREEVIPPALTEVGDYAVTDAKANTPVDTGELRDSIRVFTNEVRGNRGRLAFGSTLIYAAQVEDGGSRNVARHMIGGALAKTPARLGQQLEAGLNRVLKDLNL